MRSTETTARQSAPLPGGTAALIVGCIDGELPASDRAATTLATGRFGNDVVVCSPHFDEPALRYALAAGVTHVVDSFDQCRASVYLLGRGGAGVEGDLAAARLAKSLGAVLVLEVLDVEVIAGAIQVCRDLGRGAREILTLSGPSVLVISDDAPQSIYVSRYRQAAVTLRSDPLVSSKTPSPVSWEPARLRAKTSDLRGKTSGEARHRLMEAFGIGDDTQQDDPQVIVADAEICAEHLVRYLAHHGFVDRALAPQLKQRHELPTVPVPAFDEASGVIHVVSRAPRRVGDPGHGRRRHPRRYACRTPAIRPEKLSRGPRPLGSRQPPSPRGPVPISHSTDTTHGSV